MSLHLEVDPFNESTWQNHPAPGRFPDFERELLALGGTHLNGRALLRLSWAPDQKKIKLGRPRHKYRDTRIPTRRVERGFGYNVKRLGDPDEAWQYVPHERIGDYGPKFIAVPNMEVEVVTVAWQRWVIEHYVPPERLDDTPASWEARRYRRFTPPETNVETFGDDTGPFPAEGVYRLMLVIQSTALVPAFDTAATYGEPARDVLNVLSASLGKRERHHESLSLEERIRNDYEAAEEEDRRMRAELDQRLDDELKPYDRAAEGNAFVSVPELPTGGDG